MVCRHAGGTIVKRLLKKPAQIMSTEETEKEIDANVITPYPIFRYFNGFK